MRLVGSSDPLAVSQAEDMQLINERLALANGVATALDVANGRYIDGVAGAALDLLRRWVRARYPPAASELGLHVNDGLDQMMVPPGGEEAMEQLQLATHVCARLAWLYTADHEDEFVKDKNRISEALDVWRAHRPADTTRWRRPVEPGPEITLPYMGERLSATHLAYVKKSSAERQADSWNEMLNDNQTYGPRTGLSVTVAAEPVNGRWPLVWY